MCRILAQLEVLLMTTLSLLRTAATLSGALLAIGLTGPVSAQSTTDQSKAAELARGQRL